MQVLVPDISVSDFFDLATHNLYLGLTLLIFGGLLLFQRLPVSSGELGVGIKKQWKLLVLPFIILWVFAFTRDWVGTDYGPYYEVYNYSSFIPLAQRDTTMEPGFWYFNALLHKVVPYEYFGFVFFYFIILLFTCKSVTYFNNRNGLSFAFALLAYMTLWYFYSFNVLRICVASSIVTYAFRYLVEKRFAHYFIIVALCFNIHMSSAVMLLPGALYMLYRRFPKVAIISLAAFFVVLNVTASAVAQFIPMERYQNYLVMDSSSGLGFNLFFTYIPLFYCFFVGKKYMDRELWELCLVFTLFAFVIHFGGYRLIFLGRLQIYAVVPFLIFIPSFVASLKHAPKLVRQFNSVCLFVYFMFKYYLFLPQLYWADGIMPYKSLLF